MFLTPQQLRELTGYAQRRRQVAWLTRHQIPHFVNAAGRVIVQADALNKRPVPSFELGPVR